METDFRAECVAIFRFVRIESADTVRLGGVEFRCVADHLVAWLQCEIYRIFFCSMTACTSPEPVSLFMRSLSSANVGGGPWPKESFTAQPGSYFAFGPPELPGTKWLRFYWNVTPQGAISLTRTATSLLTSLFIPFRLKVLLDTSTLRRDAAVLYIPLQLWPAARDVISSISEQLNAAAELQPDTPLFTKRLRPGVGLAEDPQTGVSFGMHRSWLMARSLTRSYIADHTSDDQQWSDLNAEFAREGLSLQMPYLNAGSTVAYEF